MNHQLILDSKIEAINKVEALIESLKGDLSIKEDVYANIMVAVTEAVNNSIQHGNMEDTSKKVVVDLEVLNPYRMLVRIKDQGKGFDPDSLPDPTAPENIENIGGRGVFLMTHLSDSIEFQDNGRQVEMTFNI
ncbi:MAG: ATP-binding protein [Bacteroidota bacterium]